MSKNIKFITILVDFTSSVSVGNYNNLHQLLLIEFLLNLVYPEAKYTIAFSFIRRFIVYLKKLTKFRLK
jgi:hypothetical protein